MKVSKSIGGPRQEIKSYRQQKSDELYNFARDLEKNCLEMRDQEHLITMLKKSAQNLMDVKDKWMIGDNTKSVLKDCTTDAFFCLQDAINSIEEDPWDNEWRCDFSNRMMHKSLPLQSFRKDLINVQRMVYNLLKNLVNNPYEHLVEFSEGDFEIRDMNFHINDYHKR